MKTLMSNLTGREARRIKYLFCEKHLKVNEARDVIGLSFLACRECREEDRIERETRSRLEEENRKMERLKLEKELKNSIAIRGRLLKKFLETKIDFEVASFYENKKYANPDFKKNIFIYGNTGTGKTLFAHYLMRCNIWSYPLYINCEVYEINEGDFKLNEKIRVVDGHELLVLDEAQNILGSEFYKKMILHCYDSGIRMMLLSNIKFTEFAEKIGERLLSRLQEGGLQLINFTGKNLRIS